MKDRGISTRIPTAAKLNRVYGSSLLGCMRNYLILKDKARQFNDDAEIQGLVAELGTRGRRGLGYDTE